MVIVKLTSGLGNQMFQYAAGYAVAKKLGTELKIDLSWYKNTPQKEEPRQLSLTNFRAKIEPTTQTEALKIKLTKLANQYVPQLGLGFYEQIRSKSTMVDKRVLEATGDIYLDGYWQSEQYFEGVASEIKSIYQPKRVSKKMSVWLKRIKGKNSVAVHVRRGDYTYHPSAFIFKVLGDDYYKKAVAYIKQRVDKPGFFVFTDDIEWVRKSHFLPAGTVVVSGNNLADWQELWLMAACKHTVMANSTFSWWGAWLKDKSGKIVISPRSWFKGKQIRTGDILPERWARL